MGTEREQEGIQPENLNFLLQIEYLVKQMSGAKIPLEEGYQRLLTLVFNHDQTEAENTGKNPSK